jgi:hypothetical protein
MPRISSRKRALIALAGYCVLGIFGLAYFLLKQNAPTLTTNQHLILSGVAVAPLVLALLWEHLKGVKVGQVEITLNEVSPPMPFDLATQLQELEASVTPALAAAMRAALGDREFKLLAINLRSTPYWWSTRLYLLAALAEEYTHIERFVFVEQDAAQIFVGLAAPAGVRKALARRFPDLERVFRLLQQGVVGFPDSASEVDNIINRWSTEQQLFASDAQGFVQEKAVRQLTTCAMLLEWLPSALETESRQWSGAKPSSSLYAMILSCTQPYVPLLNGQRLERVVNRGELAAKLADSVVS